MIDFSKIEGVTPEVLANCFILSLPLEKQTEINNSLDVAKAEFKIKMDNMDAKTKEAHAVADKFKGLDPDEIPVLQEARKKNPELEGALDEMRKERDEYLTKLESRESELQLTQFKDTISKTVNSFNTQNPDISVRDDMREFVDDLAIKHFRDIDGKLIPHKADGTPLITKDGYGNESDWLAQLREDKPSLFNSPTGSGATGSKGQGGENYASYFKPETRNLTKQAELKKSNPELYRSLSK